MQIKIKMLYQDYQEMVAANAHLRKRGLATTPAGALDASAPAVIDLTKMNRFWQPRRVVSVLQWSLIGGFLVWEAVSLVRRSGLAALNQMVGKNHLWVIVMLAILAWSLWWVRKAKKRGAELAASEPERLLEVHDDGIRVSLPSSSREFAWIAFQTAVETPRLFLLYTVEHECQVVPKRCLTEHGGVDGFRRVLNERMWNRSVRAFPVQMDGGAKERES